MEVVELGTVYKANGVPVHVGIAVFLFTLNVIATYISPSPEQ